MKNHAAYWPQVYLSVALTTLGSLLLELSLTRIFSVVFYYHLAFLAISIALFGLGVGGVLSYATAGWKSSLFTKLGNLSLANVFLTAVALIVVLAQGVNLSVWNYAIIYLAASLPFVVSGVILSLAIGATIERIDRVYFFDLAGAAAGCLLLIPLLNLAGGPGAVVAAAAFFAAAAAIWYTLAGAVRWRIASVAVALLVVAFITYNRGSEVLGIRHAKGKAIPQEFFHQWNHFSRIGAAHIAEKDKDGKTKKINDMIFIDADASTGIAKFDFNHLSDDQRRDLLTQPPALPYAIRPGAKTLIIGPGGGWDVARALASGSHDVTAVEINPIIAETIMQKKFPELSNWLYFRPDVHVYVDDGRSFVRRSADHYQVLQATLVDTWASTAAGAFALSENNLYTTDALHDYLLHLTDDGLIAFTRWGFDPPRESLRFVSLAIEALAEIGERDPARHIIVGRSGNVSGWGSLDTVIIARKPLSADDIERAQNYFSPQGTRAVYFPGSAEDNQFRQLLLAKDPDDYERDYRFDITPVSDNRPFFFYTVQPRDLLTFMKTASPEAADFRAVNQAVPLLFSLLAISLAATALILILPPVVLGTRLPKARGVRPFLLYFLFIGAGYILVEVALIQKFVLFLGHPTYALIVVIFTLLLSSGLGSAASKRLIAMQEARLIKTLGTVALLAAFLALLTSSSLASLVWMPIGVRIALSVVMIAPAGFVMGMPFPTGLRRLEEWHAPAVRWAWSLNAASSVLGSVTALVCAIYIGLVQTMIVGGLFYLAALAVVARVRPPAVESVPEPGAGRVVLAS